MDKLETTQMQRKSYRTWEAAAATGLSEGLIKKKIREGEIRVKRVGRAVIILAEDLEKWLQSEQ